MNRILQLLIALDQMVNVVISLAIGGGWADETISARAYRTKGVNKYWLITYKTINHIFFWQIDHCEQAYESEKNQKQLPPRYRTN
ncbi:MAG: hypothetical protein COA83_09650 [Methylophaga sp.]|nr:MAG: hypothetical protein COA83_09650 [Methylophaga sp.]